MTSCSNSITSFDFCSHRRFDTTSLDAFLSEFEPRWTNLLISLLHHHSILSLQCDLNDQPAFISCEPALAEVYRFLTSMLDQSLTNMCFLFLNTVHKGLLRTEHHKLK